MSFIRFPMQVKILPGIFYAITDRFLFDKSYIEGKLYQCNRKIFNQVDDIHDLVDYILEDKYKQHYVIKYNKTESPAYINVLQKICSDDPKFLKYKLLV